MADTTEAPIVENSVTTLSQENNIPTDTVTTSSSIPATSTDYVDVDYQSVKNELEDMNAEEEEQGTDGSNSYLFIYLIFI